MIETSILNRRGRFEISVTGAALGGADLTAMASQSCNDIKGDVPV
jgi:hypothetical protein